MCSEETNRNTLHGRECCETLSNTKACMFLFWLEKNKEEESANEKAYNPENDKYVWKEDPEKFGDDLCKTLEWMKDFKDPSGKKMKDEQLKQNFDEFIDAVNLEIEKDIKRKNII